MNDTINDQPVYLASNLAAHMAKRQVPGLRTVPAPIMTPERYMSSLAQRAKRHEIERQQEMERLDKLQKDKEEEERKRREEALWKKRGYRVKPTKTNTKSRPTTRGANIATPDTDRIMTANQPDKKEAIDKREYITKEPKIGLKRYFVSIKDGVGCSKISYDGGVTWQETSKDQDLIK